MLIAATQNDETNILACQLAHMMYKTQTKIARVRGRSYLDHPELFSRSDNNTGLAVDFLISPESLVTNYILQLIEYPGSLQVIDFHHGKLRLVAMKVYEDGQMNSQPIRDLKRHLPNLVKIRIVAIYRQQQVIMPTGDVVIQAGDEVFFLAEPQHIQTIITEFRKRRVKPSRNIMIGGGGNIGFHLAKALEEDHQVKMIDHNMQQARENAEKLDQTIIIHGDIADKDLLIEENIDEIDLFIAVTNSDEANIISGMLAKKLGVRRVIALVNNTSYVEMIQLNGIDIAISADSITTNNLLHYTRQDDTVKAVTLRRGAAEAVEVVAHGSENTSAIIGRTIGEIPWPNNITVGAIVRQDKVIIAHRDVEIMAEDHIIIFITDYSSNEALNELVTPKNASWFS